MCLVEKVQSIHSHFTAVAEGNLCGLHLSARWIEHITAHLLYDEALSFLWGHRDINVKKKQSGFLFCFFRFLKMPLFGQHLCVS